MSLVKGVVIALFVVIAFIIISSACIHCGAAGNGCTWTL